VHWHTVVAALGRARQAPLANDRAVFQGLVGIAAPNESQTGFGGPMMRTTDGGRVWRPVPDFRWATGGLQVLPDGAMFATGNDSKNDCNGVYRSDDLGVSWTALPGSCVKQQLLALQFLGREDGVAVGGQALKFGGGQIIEHTSDGGATWTVTRNVGPGKSYRPANEGLGHVDFVSPFVGYVGSAMCVGGQNGPCDGDIFITVDGGLRLSRLPRPRRVGASNFAVVGDDALVAATTQAGDGASAVATTSDVGARWQLQAPPVIADGGRLFGSSHLSLWQNSLGWFVNRDRGRRWVPAVRPRRIRRALDDRPSASRAVLWRLAEPGLGSQCWVRHSVDAAATWTALRLPPWVCRSATHIWPNRAGGAIFASGLALWRTHDGGATWRESWPRLPGEGRRRRS
jgi:photosystem II stability/assembly factor-like uncharacterized protein